MDWRNHDREFRVFGEHAFLSPSSHSWVNYSDEKMSDVYLNRLAVSRGTALHSVAADLIKLKVRLPNDVKKALNMHVNDAITLGLRPEQRLFYSKYCYGTADAIGIVDNVLYIHDLKTGKNKASFMQLRIYAAIFFLEYEDYGYGLSTFDDIILSIYQGEEIRTEHVCSETILPIMDKIVRFSRFLETLEEEYNDTGTDPFRSGT